MCNAFSGPIERSLKQTRPTLIWEREKEREIPSTLGKLIWNLTDPPALNAGARCHGWSILIILGTEEREREWESKSERERCTLAERNDWSRASFIRTRTNPQVKRE